MPNSKSERKKLAKLVRAVFNFDDHYMAGTFRARSIDRRPVQIDAERSNYAQAKSMCGRW